MPRGGGGAEVQQTGKRRVPALVVVLVVFVVFAVVMAWVIREGKDLGLLGAALLGLA
jgi:hypothetical protein